MSKLNLISGLLHGCDYNPEQWLDRPDVLEEDIRLMKRAGINVVTLGVFAWSSLEPKEGVYTFDWLDDIMDSLHQNDIRVILSTVSGGKPPWLVKKYPDCMRMNDRRERLLYGDRENQCNSHPGYLQKVRQMDDMLARRYARHPALILWHVSNEVYGTCHCPRCQELFRIWLRRKYGCIEELNRQWWTAFWSHGYSDFEEIESPSPIGEMAVHGLALDYWRFYSELSVDLIRMEIETLRLHNPDIPVTSNMFHMDCGVDYHQLAKVLDVTAGIPIPAGTAAPMKTAIGKPPFRRHSPSIIAVGSSKASHFCSWRAPPAPSTMRKYAALSDRACICSAPCRLWPTGRIPGSISNGANLGALTKSFMGRW